MRKQTKAAWRSIFKKFVGATGGLFWMSVLMICFALVHYDDEDASNTYTISGTVSDVRYSWIDFMEKYVRSGTVNFKIGGEDCFYKLADAGSDSPRKVYNNYKRLEQSGKEVTAIITEDWDVDCPQYGHRVIGIVGESGDCFSVESHNRYQRLARISFCVIAMPAILCVFYSQLKIVYREIIVPSRKRRERERRRLEIEEKERQAPIVQNSSPPKIKQKSKKNKSKKSR